MSTLEVNKITPQGTATEITLGDSGDTFTVASGATIGGFKSTGIDDNATSTAITIDSSENVGIGETSPLGLVHIKSADSGISSVSGGANELVLENSGDTGMTISSGTSASCLINFADSGSNSIGGFDYNHADNGLRIRTNGSEAMRIDSSRNVLVGRTDNPSGVSNCIYALGNYGITTGSGANVFINSEGLFFRSTSSLKYKNTIQDSTNGLTELLTLRPVTYKGNNDGNKIFGGLIAEEVHEAGLTEFVEYDDEGNPDALHYGNMVSLCIKAIQELKADNDALRTRIETLENA